MLLFRCYIHWNKSTLTTRSSRTFSTRVSNKHIMGKTICSSHETTERIYSKFDIWVYIGCHILVVDSTSSTKHVLREDAEI